MRILKQSHSAEKSERGTITNIEFIDYRSESVRRSSKKQPL